MRISIFNLSDKSNYKVEYNKMIKVLNSKCITYKTKHYTYFEFINKNSTTKNARSAQLTTQNSKFKTQNSSNENTETH